MHIHPLQCGIGLGFLIELPHGLYLCDTGSPGQEQRVLAKMQALGRADLKAIWITHAHYDHYGSAAALRELTGAKIGVHPADAESMQAGLSPLGTTRRYGWIIALFLPLVNRIRPLPATPPDFLREDDETLSDFGLDATILHTPGHTPGHTCMLLPGGIALAADLIASVPHTQLQQLFATDWEQLPYSLQQLKAAHPEWIYTGHSQQPMPGAQLQAIKAN